MVREQVQARGIDSPWVLRALLEVPREDFLPSELRPRAYDDDALPIIEGQTISQPFVVALMMSALSLAPGARALEIGTGSGYAAAVLSRVASEVYTIERHEALVDLAKATLQAQGYENVHIRHGDGTLGWPEHAPYDAILVSAGGPDVPLTLREQLKVGGVLVMPVGLQLSDQQLVRVTRTGADQYESEGLGPVRFVPLIGRHGWEKAERPPPIPPDPPGDGPPA
jgi:protein-L-isoaspartate(D-aspartate) O-methyltransferase